MSGEVIVMVTQFRSTHSIDATKRWIIISSILAATTIALYDEKLAALVGAAEAAER